MPRPKTLLPTYSKHSSGQARVLISGKYHYLGKYGTPESKIEYARLIALIQSGQEIPPKRAAKPSELTVADVVAKYLMELQASYHYKSGGVVVTNPPKLPSQVSVMRSACAPLVELYAETPAPDFGPLALMAVRQLMIRRDWARTTINNQISRIKQIWKWAVSKELIPVECWTRLTSVAGLQKGRSQALEPEPRAPVSPAHVEAVRAKVSPLVRDLIDLQLSTGARSGELLSLTGGILDKSGPVWVARLDVHKTAHRGKARSLHFGPQSQEILAKYLTGKYRTTLFQMTRSGYCRAVTRACESLGIPRWVPHQLRHTHATMIRDHFGIEHAQAALGHSSMDMTAHYAQVSEQKAREVAAQIG